jgi:hypothetical protein
MLTEKADAQKAFMNIVDYRVQISFRFIQPRTWLPSGYGKVSTMMRGIGLPVDILNTSFSDEFATVRDSLHKICKIPRMSTIAIGALINQSVAHMPDDQAFVNVGVWHGFTFLSGIAANQGKRAIGIDNFSKFGGPREEFMARFNSYKSARHEFYEMDYRDYFQKIHRGEIGFYIYDGDHSYENQLEGLRIADPFLAKDALVLIDDINREAPRTATVDFVTERKGKYRIILDEPTSRNCHPTFWNGIMMLQKMV